MFCSSRSLSPVAHALPWNDRGKMCGKRLIHLPTGKGAAAEVCPECDRYPAILTVEK